MKMQLACVTLLGVGAALVLAGGQQASAEITGSAHDFKGAGWNTGAEICAPCHTPHKKSDVTVTTTTLLWNHEETAATFGLYTSGTMQGVTGQPAGISRLCLSCHDGTVALDSFGGQTGPASGAATGTALIGTNLSAHHPIGFLYNAALVALDADLVVTTTAASGLGGGTIKDTMLFQESLECASCHDVHNKGNFSNLLVKSNAASALCLTCHIK